jgi:copper homeostasis protein
MVIEICIDSVEGALAAQRGGADRIELCGSLGEGGVTPSAGLIKIARERIDIGLQVMIRPRGGDFLYTPAELAVLREDIRIAKDLGADGIVFGCLTAAGDIDLEQMGSLIPLARPCGVTFHRAFDMCRDPRKALEDLVGLGVDRLLTSGQAAGCVTGMALLGELQRQSKGRIVVMPGGGVTPQNVLEIVTATGVGEIHLSARSMRESGMLHRNPRCSMGADGAEEYQWKTTDEAVVRAVVEQFH